MSKKIFEFWCPNCESSFEAMAWDNKETKQCSCGTNSKAIFTPVRSSLDGTDPAFSTEWDLWAKRHEEATRQEERKIAEHGDA